MPHYNKLSFNNRFVSQGTVIPVFLIIIATVVKGYAFSQAGLTIPVLLYGIVVVMSGLYGGRKSAISACIASVIGSIIIVLHPQVYDNIPQQPYSLPVLYIVGAIFMFILVHSYLLLLEQQSEGRNQFKFLADSVPNMICLADKAGRATYYSKEWYQFTGYTSFEEIKANVWRIVHPDEKEAIRALYKKNIIEGRGYEIESRLLGPDGTYRWYSSKMLPMVNNKGEIDSWIGSCTDIHYQKMIAEKIRESQNYFHLLADSAPIIVWESDHEGAMSYLSKQWIITTGMGAADSHGKNWRRAIHPEDIDTQGLEFEASRSKSLPYEGKFRIKCADGEYRRFLCIGQPFVRDRIEGYAGTLTYIPAEELVLSKA